MFSYMNKLKCFPNPTNWHEFWAELRYKRRAIGSESVLNVNYRRLTFKKGKGCSRHWGWGVGSSTKCKILLFFNSVRAMGHMPKYSEEKKKKTSKIWNMQNRQGDTHWATDRLWNLLYRYIKKIFLPFFEGRGFYFYFFSLKHLKNPMPIFLFQWVFGYLVSSNLLQQINFDDIEHKKNISDKIVL